MLLFMGHHFHLQSSSTMVTVAWSGSPSITPLDSNDELIMSIKLSLCSYILSAVIGTSNVAVVCPTGIVTVYGPKILSTPPPVTC